MSWSVFQREVLAEMGFRPYRLDAQVAAPRGVSPMLFEALQRAAGSGLAGVADLQGLDALHGDPAAKRALWPLLRRLRAGG